MRIICRATAAALPLIVSLAAANSAAAFQVTCSTQVATNHFIAFHVTVTSSIGCDGAIAPIRQFLEHGKADGFRCVEKYIEPHPVNCFHNGTGGQISFVYKPHRLRGASRAPLSGSYFGADSRGDRVRFTYLGAAVRNFQLVTRGGSTTSFASTPVKNRAFNWTGAQATVDGQWSGDETVVVRVVRSGMSPSVFTVTRDARSPSGPQTH